MASTDATPIPIKNQAYRVSFPIYDSAGDLVTSAGSLDSEVSKDGAAFADVNPGEATEIGTSGTYYLDLTATEMNADTVIITVKSTGGTTTVIILYPAGTPADIPVDVQAIDGSLTAAQYLALSAATIVPGVTEAGTLSATQMTTDLVESADNHYNGRLVIFLDNNLQWQMTNITDYLGSTGMITMTEVTEAPAIGDAFIIV